MNPFFLNSWTKTAVIGVIAAGVLLCGVYSARRAGTDHLTYSNDFNVYYYASREVISGADPYKHSLIPSAPYIYPPLLSELLVPLALLPLPIAAYVWFILNAASMVLALLAATRVSVESGSRWMRWITAILGVLLVARFILDNFEWGQVNPLVVMLATCHIFLFDRRKKLAAALVLALAVSLKMTPAILLLYHLARKRVRFTLHCSVLIIGITALSFALFGNRAAESFQRFVERTVQNQHGFDLSYSGNQSLRGFLSRLSSEPLDAAREPWTPTSLLGSAFLVLICVVAARKTTDETGAAALFFCLWLIVSPLTWKAHYVGLLLPAVYLVRCGLAFDTGLKRAAFWTVIGLVFVTFNLTSSRIIGQDGAYWVEQRSLILAACIMVLVCILIFSGRLSGSRADNQMEPAGAGVHIQATRDC